MVTTHFIITVRPLAVESAFVKPNVILDVNKNKSGLRIAFLLNNRDLYQVNRLLKKTLLIFPIYKIIPFRNTFCALIFKTD